MKTGLLYEDHDLRTFVLVLGTGDETMRALALFAAENRLKASQFSAIGAFERAVVAYFDWASKEYRNISIDEQVEVLSMSGDITLENRSPKVHAHVVLGKSDATAHGGHLVEGHVRPTLELLISELPRHLYRRHDQESGLALIDPFINR
jgi:hypothetical protein